jgi:hypothetical protein
MAGVVLFFAESKASENPELERWILIAETAATLAVGVLISQPRAAEWRTESATEI